MINRVWREGVVTDASAASRGDGQRRITVCVPGADGAPPADVVVFQDSSERVWARDAFQKRGAKTSGLRRGWAFSGVVSGQWLVRGHAAAVTSERREETFSLASAPSVYASVYADPQGLGPKTKLEAGSACASPRRPGSRESAGEKARGMAGRDASAFSAPERFARKIRGVRPRSSPERGGRLNVARPKRPKRRCRSSPSPARAAPAPGRQSRGFAGADAGREIQRRGLVKLGGRTRQHRVLAPVAGRALHDVARGAHALADVVRRHAANATAPPPDGAGVPAPRRRVPTPDGVPDDGDKGPSRRPRDDDATRLLSDESLEEVVEHARGTRTHVSVAAAGVRLGPRRAGRRAGASGGPSLRSRCVSASWRTRRVLGGDQVRRGREKRLRRGRRRRRRRGQPSSRRRRRRDVELSAELSAGVLIGLRSGKRPVWDRR